MTETNDIIGPDTVLAGRYRLTAEIGRGGFGMVYRARQINMDRDVAIKILPPEFMTFSDIVERFKREARLASRLSHPNTITLHDYGQHENMLFIVMEFLQGEDLAEVLREHRCVERERAVDLARQILRSLAEAHDLGIVHRDLKPENIYLSEVGSEQDHVKVLDFGIAKLAAPQTADAADEMQRRLTMSGSTVGTPAYMSPEQAAGEEVDPRTDLYAVGVMLYEMVCGEVPFHDENPVKIMRAHLFEEVPPLSVEELRDTRFEMILRKAMAKEPEDRFGHADDFLEALEKPGLFESLTPAVPAGESSPEIVAPPFSLGGGSSTDDASEDVDALALGETATFDAQSTALQDVPSHRDHPHAATLDFQGSDSVPFGAVPESPRGAAEEGPPRIDLHQGSTTSSIITVLEPGSPDDEDDIILLTTPKEVRDEEPGDAGTSSPEHDPSQRGFRHSGEFTPPDTEETLFESVEQVASASVEAESANASSSTPEPDDGLELAATEHDDAGWSWGEAAPQGLRRELEGDFSDGSRRDSLDAVDPDTDALDARGGSRTRTSVLVMALLLAIAAGGIVAVLYAMGYLEI